MLIMENKTTNFTSEESWRSSAKCKESDSDSNTFEDDQQNDKIKPEVELKEETGDLIYKTDTQGNLKLVCSGMTIQSVNSDVCDTSLNDIHPPSQFDDCSEHLKDDYIQAKLVVAQSDIIKDQEDIDISLDTSEDVEQYSDNFSPCPSNILTYQSQESFQLPTNNYPGPSQQKLFTMDDLQFHSRIYPSLEPNCDNKVTYQLNVAITSGKQSTSVRDGDNLWMYNLQTVRIPEEVMNIPELQYVKNTYDQFESCEKSDGSDNDTSLWQLYQELLTQKKLEASFSLSEEQKKEKMREIGRIRARLYRAKLRQNVEAWKKYKAMRAQKQREERLKLSDEQREKAKALARIRARKHREKLRENAETWKQYKEMRAKKQRLDRLKAKEQAKVESQKFDECVSNNSERMKELARERAKKHRDRLKENTDTWCIYKESRAQRKRQERLTMSSEQRELLKERARIRARKYREKMKEDVEEWKKYKEMRARKQREERLKLSEEQKQKAKALARERAKLYREKKRLKQQMVVKESTDNPVSVSQAWCDSNNQRSYSLYFYHSLLQSPSKTSIE